MSTFDVFLSHNSVDKPWVSKLKDDLQRYGLSVWLDRDEIRPGDLFAAALEDGLSSSRAVALVVSPEAMTSGWVKEEYYRALSLTKDKTSPLQLIPVILRTAAVPDFCQSRNWVDFRDEKTYAQSVWKLVWGITGEKPPQVLDLTAPAPLHLPPARSTTITSTPPQPTPPAFRSGGVKAKNIKADNVVLGIQGDAETIRAAAGLQMESGTVEAEEKLEAGNLVLGVQNPAVIAELKQFRQELAALREQLTQAIAAGEIADEEEIADAQTALARITKQAEAEHPSTDNLAKNLDWLTDILNRAGKTAQAAGNFGATVIKLAPLAAGLKQLVELLF